MAFTCPPFYGRYRKASPNAWRYAGQLDGLVRPFWLSTACSDGFVPWSVEDVDHTVWLEADKLVFETRVFVHRDKDQVSKVARENQARHPEWKSGRANGVGLDATGQGSCAQTALQRA
jgi:hypothetical protein